MNLKNMWKKHTPDPNKYGLIEINYHGPMEMPWPRLPEGDYSKVPLKEEYRMYSMDYLDTLEAKPIFEAQADFIMKHNHKTIIDVGCRHGPVNDILYERGYIDEDYHYFGFDTSPEPIEYAKETWEEFPNITYKVGTYKFINGIMNREDTREVEYDYQVNFEVDCIIWSGVLLYEPQQHQKYFQLIQIAYGARHAIIQEPMKEQRPECWMEGLELNTIARFVRNNYKTKYHKYEEVITDCDIFGGARLIAHITCHRPEGRRSRTWTNDYMYGCMCTPEYGKLSFEQWKDIPTHYFTPDGLKIIPYIWKGKVNPRITFKELWLCDIAFDLMEKERHNHRLADNYTKKGLHLDKMWIYNIVFAPILIRKRYKHNVRGKQVYHEHLQPMFTSGAQQDGNAVRIFSRYFAFEKYKTDGTKLLDKVDDWQELKWVMMLLGWYLEHNIVYWSRDKSPDFFHRLKKAKPEFFDPPEDNELGMIPWEIHPEKINIIYPNNMQYVFYCGQINELLKFRPL